MDYKELEKAVIQWGEPKGLTEKKGMLKSWGQYQKVLEEVQEIGTAMVHGHLDGVVDGIGDAFVTLILLAKQHELEPTYCLEYAYNQIKNRTGKTINGVFVKDEDPTPAISEVAETNSLGILKKVKTPNGEGIITSLPMSTNGDGNIIYNVVLDDSHDEVQCYDYELQVIHG